MLHVGFVPSNPAATSVSNLLSLPVVNVFRQTVLLPLTTW